MLPDNQMNKIKAYLSAGKPLVALPLRTPIEHGCERHPRSRRPSNPDGRREAISLPFVALLCSPAEGDLQAAVDGKSVGASKRKERVDNPVAWTNTHKGDRVFCTSLGHPKDFKVKSFRGLLINAIFWTLGKPVPPAE